MGKNWKKKMGSILRGAFYVSESLSFSYSLSLSPHSRPCFPACLLYACDRKNHYVLYVLSTTSIVRVSSHFLPRSVSLADPFSREEDNYDWILDETPRGE